MKRFALIFPVPCILLLGGVVGIAQNGGDDVGKTASAEASAESTDDTQAIKTAIASYAKAFNARDAKALAQHWSPEGVYNSRINDDEIVGRAALEKEFQALFEEVKDAKLELTTESIEFVSPNVALEQGAATVIHPGSEPEKSTYSVVYIKRDGKWLIDRVSDEQDAPPPPTHYEQLKELEWMVGQWVDDAGGSTIKTECKWTRNQNFITRSFTATVGERVDITGMQFVGWDASRKQIRSWVFDSDGGVAEGTWKHEGEHWSVKNTVTLPSGKMASSTTVLRPFDDDSFGWQQINRIVDGEILPNLDEVIIVREGTQ